MESLPMPDARLCRFDELADPGSRGFEVELNGVPESILVVRRGDRCTATSIAARMPAARWTGCRISFSVWTNATSSARPMLPCSPLMGGMRGRTLRGRPAHAGGAGTGRWLDLSRPASAELDVIPAGSAARAQLRPGSGNRRKNPPRGRVEGGFNAIRIAQSGKRVSVRRTSSGSGP